MSTHKVAVIGSGNIGTDLTVKIQRLSEQLEVAALVGIDPGSDGLARARRLGIRTTADGVDGLIAMPDFDRIGIVLDATSASAHVANAARLAPYGKQLIDLTPAALGPYVVPVVNLEEHLGASNLNMVTCGGQATIPVIAAVGGSPRFTTARSWRRSPHGPPARVRAPTSTSSPKPPVRRSKRSAAPPAAKRSSSSIRPSLR